MGYTGQQKTDQNTDDLPKRPKTDQLIKRGVTAQWQLSQKVKRLGHFPVLTVGQVIYDHGNSSTVTNVTVIRIQFNRIQVKFSIHSMRTSSVD